MHKLTNDDDTLVAEFGAWLERKGLAPLTTNLYKTCIKELLADGYDIANAASLNAFLDKHCTLKRSLYYFAAVRAFLAYHMVGDRAACRALLKALRKPQSVEPIKQRAWLSDDQVERVLSFMTSHRHRIIAILQRDLGLRAGDVLWLKREDVEFDQQDARIPLRIIVTAKGGRRRPLWVYDEQSRERLAQFIENVMVDETYLFLNSSRHVSPASQHLYTYRDYYRDLQNALFNAGVEPSLWSTHDFRRRLARKVWDKYADVAILQGVLGHVKVETTLRYLRHSGLGVRNMQRELWLSDEKST